MNYHLSNLAKFSEWLDKMCEEAVKDSKDNMTRWVRDNIRKSKTKEKILKQLEIL